MTLLLEKSVIFIKMGTLYLKESDPYGEMVYTLLICIAAILESLWWFSEQKNYIGKKLKAML